MLDNKLLDRAERESILLLHRLVEKRGLQDYKGLSTFSLLSAMFVRGWMAAVIYLEKTNADAQGR